MQSQLKQLLQEKKREVTLARGRLDQIESDLQSLLAKKNEYEEALEELEKAFTVFQTLENTWHKTFEQRLANVISRGLTIVFEEPLEFVLVQKTRGDMSALDFQIVQRFGDKEFQSNIKGAKGGGVVVVVAFLLRVLLIIAAKPKIRPILLLDESFSMVSMEYSQNLALLIRDYVDRLGLQVVLVTHDQSFGEVADVHYEVHLNKKGNSVYERITSTESRLNLEKST